MVSLTTRDNPRRYTGKLLPFNWEFEQTPCLFVGSKQSGPIYEVSEPNDGVIEGSFMDYQVKNAFSEQGYHFSLFNESRCEASSVSEFLLD